jgi:hypothetical protein
VRQVSNYIRANCVTGPVTGVQGAGFLLGLKTSRPAKEVQAALLEKNILTGTSGDPHVLRLLPAYILNEGHVDQLADALAKIPHEALSRSGRFRASRFSICSRSPRPAARPQPRALAGKILGLGVLQSELRTLASFQAGMARLGGSSFVITPGQGTWQLETRLQRRHERRGRRTHPRGHSGARLLLRCARRARLRRGQESRERSRENLFA